MKNSKKKENLKESKKVSTKNVKSELKDGKKTTSKNVVSNSTKNVKPNSLTTYIPVSKHIYNTGVSYRVRVSVKGKIVSITTPSKKEAFRVRKELLGLRG